MQICRRNLLWKASALLFAGITLTQTSNGQESRQSAQALVAPIFEKLNEISFDFKVTGSEQTGGSYLGEFCKSGSTEYGSVIHEKGHIRRHVHIVEKDIHKTITWGPVDTPAITIGRLDQVNVGYGLGDGMQLMELRFPWCNNRFQTLLEIVNDPATDVKVSQVANSNDRVLELAKDNCQATLILSAQHGFMPTSSLTKRKLKSGYVSLERVVKEFEEPATGVFVPSKIQTKSMMVQTEPTLGNPPRLVTEIQVSGIGINQPIPANKLALPNSQGVVVYDYLNNQVAKFDSDRNLQTISTRLPGENDYSPFVRINLDPDTSKARSADKFLLEKEKGKTTGQFSLGQALRALQGTAK
jgi:hypothetical protein